VPDDLFKFADIALYRVKSTGRNGYLFYSSDLDIVSRKTEALQKGLADATWRNELTIYFQPIYDLATNKPVALESLLRWRHPELGIVQPMDFIPLAERMGHIAAIGEWVLLEACRQLIEWRGQGLEIVCEVKISSRQFQDPGLVEKITGIVDQSGVDPRFIELEFTESTAMLDVERTVAMARRLKERGVRIVIDDFGAGYSSMAWLKHLNPKALKIDKFFIQNVASDANDAAIVKAIVNMAHGMGMLVIAEGVESLDQLDAIRHMQLGSSADPACDRVQGFLFSAPVPASEAVLLLGKTAELPDNRHHPHGPARAS
jgi:EAL domain-containing protein (putative c-di-GMP-specific phosphodiesterase class I)